MVSGRGRARTDAQSRGDGAGSGSSRRKPSQCSMTPGLTGPLHAEGFPVEDEQLLLVKLPSGGFGLNKRESSPGRFCPALLIAFQSCGLEAWLLSILPAAHTGIPGLRRRLSMTARMAGDGPGRLAFRAGFGGVTLAGAARRSTVVTSR